MVAHNENTLTVLTVLFTWLTPELFTKKGNYISLQKSRQQMLAGLL